MMLKIAENCRSAEKFLRELEKTEEAPKNVEDRRNISQYRRNMQDR